MIEIVKDKQLSFYNKDTGCTEYTSGAMMYRDSKLEDHLVTLNNGISVHVGCEHGTSPNIDDVITTIFANL